MKKKCAKKVIAIYLGERISALSYIYHSFKDRKGREYHFRGLRSVRVGDCYEIIDDKIATRPKAVEGFPLTEEQEAHCDAQRVVVLAFRAAQKKAMQLKRPHEDITRAIGLLRPFYLGLSELDRRRFKEYLGQEMSKKKKGRKA